MVTKNRALLDRQRNEGVNSSSACALGATRLRIYRPAELEVRQRKLSRQYHAHDLPRLL